MRQQRQQAPHIRVNGPVGGTFEEALAGPRFVTESSLGLTWEGPEGEMVSTFVDVKRTGQANVVKFRVVSTHRYSTCSVMWTGYGYVLDLDEGEASAELLKSSVMDAHDLACHYLTLLGIPVRRAELKPITHWPQSDWGRAHSL